MKIFFRLIALSAALMSAQAQTVLTQIPDPDRQGGMIMPMVVVDADTQTLSLMFGAHPMPILQGLDSYVPDSTFQPSAAWYSLLAPAPDGAGALFSSRYGFTAMYATDTFLPEAESLAIRALSFNSPNLAAWNYQSGQSFFDRIMGSDGAGGYNQVLWDGSMWHTPFTLPADAGPGTYTATFEVYVVDSSAVTDGWVGYGNYSEEALAAPRDANYNSVDITYTWTVVPEPSAWALAAAGLAGLVIARLRKKSAARA